ncbi:unnamed protein product [Paramecium sonneborni]|uniref:Transmembrane protein n=1 Tax=Paramecium sonneborni TaxID=65129 RepID=A0A8S1RQT9_9CILI|nr:unnamed protein product [Paramecium sonneborni]
MPRSQYDQCILIIKYQQLELIKMLDYQYFTLVVIYEENILSQEQKIINFIQIINFYITICWRSIKYKSYTFSRNDFKLKIQILLSIQFFIQILIQFILQSIMQEFHVMINKIYIINLNQNYVYVKKIIKKVKIQFVPGIMIDKIRKPFEFYVNRVISIQRIQYKRNYQYKQMQLCIFLGLER